MQDRDVIAIQGGHQRFGVTDDLGRGDPDRGADEIADPDFFERHVEGYGEALIDDVAAADAEHVVLAAQEMTDAPLTDGDTLGRAGGTRRVDYVGRIVRLGGAQVAGRVGLGEQVFDGPGGEVEGLQGGEVGAGRQDALGFGGTEAGRDTIDGRIGIERKPGGAVEGDTGLGYQQLDAARKPKSDDFSRAVVEPGEHAGDTFRFGEELGIGDRGRTEAQGDLGRVFPGCLTQDVRQRFFAKEFGV